MFRTFTIPLWCAMVFTPLVLVYSGVVFAQAMSGANYQIESDSINVGGAFSESDSFWLEDTTGEVATGFSESDSFELRAGYQQMQAVTITLTQPDSVVMDSTIAGLTGGSAMGSTTFAVTTDNPAGYQVLLTAQSDPAMRNAEDDTIADYQPAGAVPDYEFTTASTSAHFGFSIESLHAADRFLNNGAGETCGIVGGTNTAFRCWDGLNTTGVEVVRSGVANQPDGTESTIHFQVEIGDNVSQPPGTYVATTTVTAVPL